MTIIDERVVLVTEDQVDVLFKEAHQRRRRRRLGIGTLVLLGVAAAVVAPLALNVHSQPIRSPGQSSTIPTPGSPVRPAGRTLLAWVDYNGALHLGTVSGASQRIVATADADPTTPLVWLGHTVYWVRSQAQYKSDVATPMIEPSIEGFDTTTGRTIRVGSGSQIFPSLDRSFLYVLTDDYQHLREYSPQRGWSSHVMALPQGWTVASASLLGNPSPVIAHGILVQSPPTYTPTTVLAPNLAIWDPATGSIRVLGPVWKYIGTYTAPGVGHSLIAWFPSPCSAGHGQCMLAVTNSATLSTHLIANPNGAGFNWGGGFSSNGRQLAVFVSLTHDQFAQLPKYQQSSPATELAIVNTKTNTIRVVSGVVVNNGEAVAWAQWLPNRQELITGSSASSDGTPVDYLVNTATDHVQPVTFFPGGGWQDRNLTVNLSGAIGLVAAQGTSARR